MLKFKKRLLSLLFIPACLAQLSACSTVDKENIKDYFSIKASLEYSEECLCSYSLEFTFRETADRPGYINVMATSPVIYYTVEIKIPKDIAKLNEDHFTFPKNEKQLWRVGTFQFPHACLPEGKVNVDYTINYKITRAYGIIRQEKTD